jgi:hypothetical protein
MKDNLLVAAIEVIECSARRLVVALPMYPSLPRDVPQLADKSLGSRCAGAVPAVTKRVSSVGGLDQATGPGDDCSPITLSIRISHPKVLPAAK